LGKLQFLRNFNTKLKTHAVNFGISAAEVTYVENATDMFGYLLRMQESFKTFKQEISAYKNMIRNGEESETPHAFPVIPTLPAPPVLVNNDIFGYIRRLVARIKAHPAYDEAIGEDLGIVGDEHVVDKSSLRPILKSRIEAGHPVIIWKKGTADALDIYVDRKDGKGFVLLATDFQPDYTDKHPVPKDVESIVWEYKAAYRIGDKQVGHFSDVVRVAVAKQV